MYIIHYVLKSHCGSNKNLSFRSALFIVLYFLKTQSAPNQSFSRSLVSILFTYIILSLNKKSEKMLVVIEDFENKA